MNDRNRKAWDMINDHKLWKYELYIGTRRNETRKDGNFPREVRQFLN